MIGKSPKILIVGFGSIGQRHYKNLLGLGYKDVFVYDLDKEKVKNLPNKISELNEKNLEDFDVVFVANPTNEHIKTALLGAKAGCHLFVEKPLSHSNRDLLKLLKLTKLKKLITMVGCNMRFHPCLAFIKKYLDDGKLGKVSEIKHQFGYYLPFWRLNQDYRQNYAAKKETGGGIILDDIHEFDLLFWLNNFAEVAKHKITAEKISDLEIETEDSAYGEFLFKNGVRGEVKCDYISKTYVRTCKVVGEKGVLFWDWNENIVWLEKDGQKKRLFSVKNYDINSMYVDELKYFLDKVAKNEPTFNDVECAKSILNYCLNHE